MTLTVSSHGFRLQVQARSDGFWELFDNGTWEPWTLQVLHDRLRPGARYVDIGAWVGPTVLFAAATGAFVEGFEPDPGALPELEANVAANPDLAGRVTIHPVALSRAGGIRVLVVWDQPGDSMSSLAHRTENAAAGSGVSVSVEPVQDWLGRAAFDADLVKIDIEGGEYELLPAMRAYLSRQRPDLLLSLHAYHLAQRADAIARRGVPRKIAAHGLVFRERTTVAWLANIYEHVYVVTGNEWERVEKRAWRRLLHLPNDYDLFFTQQRLLPR